MRCLRQAARSVSVAWPLPNARFLMQRTGLDDPYQGQASDIAIKARECCANAPPHSGTKKG